MSSDLMTKWETQGNSICTNPSLKLHLLKTLPKSFTAIVLYYAKTSELKWSLLLVIIKINSF